MSWPPDFAAEINRRQRLDELILRTADPRGTAEEFYTYDPVRAIQDWAVTVDPRNATRNLPTTMPFIPFKRQIELIEELWHCVRNQEPVLIEKTRDMGATWISAAFSVWLWQYHPGSAIGWGSRKAELVDRLGVPDSIFEKLRILIRNMPAYVRPPDLSEKDHLLYMKAVHPTNGSTITGEAGDNIGRGGRNLIYFKDESAHYERPELIAAALNDNTDVQVDISSVNGTGNLFYRRRHGGRVRVFIMDWSDHPAKSRAWYEKRKADAEAEGMTHKFAQEVDRDYSAAVEGIFIPAKWARACVDAHKRLGWAAEGQLVFGLDPADDSVAGDKSALTGVRGNVVESCEVWGGVDTTVTTTRAWSRCLETGADLLRYESNGVGAGVKGKTNELRKGNQTKPEVQAWRAGDGVVAPEREYVKDKKNKDMFADNIGQAWWLLRDRCRKTYRMVNGLEDYPFDELMSFDSEAIGRDELEELLIELSQPLRQEDGQGRVKREPKKGPNSMQKRGIRSPNRADSLIVATAPGKVGLQSGTFSW